MYTTKQLRHLKKKKGLQPNLSSRFSFNKKMISQCLDPNPVSQNCEPLIQVSQNPNLKLKLEEHLPNILNLRPFMYISAKNQPWTLIPILGWYEMLKEDSIVCSKVDTHPFDLFNNALGYKIRNLEAIRLGFIHPQIDSYWASNGW